MDKSKITGLSAKTFMRNRSGKNAIIGLRYNGSIADRVDNHVTGGTPSESKVMALKAKKV